LELQLGESILYVPGHGWRDSPSGSIENLIRALIAKEPKSPAVLDIRNELVPKAVIVELVECIQCLGETKSTHTKARVGQEITTEEKLTQNVTMFCRGN
jgi:hypothetical protein